MTNGDHIELHDALAERKYNDVMRETWGHLAPERGRHYPGWMTFAWLDDGSWGLLQYDWEELGGNPWTLEDMNDYVLGLIEGDAISRGHVYRFDGMMASYGESGCDFIGSYSEIRTVK